MDNRSYEIIKRLTDKFFQGTISPEETDCILDMASHIPESELEKDSELCRDLRLISGLHALKPSAICDNIPDGLESRLDSHISLLARNQRRSLWKRISAASAAAVVAAAILTVGFSINHQPTDNALAMVDTVALLPELTLSVPDERPAEEETPRNIAALPNPAVVENVNPSSTSPSKTPTPKPIRPTMNKMAVSAAIPESDLSIITSAIACLPSTAAAVQEIKPILASAVVDPYDVLAQPLSTFSQAIDIVMESCKTVEKGFSEAGKTLENADDKIGLTVVMSPLHDI